MILNSENLQQLTLKPGFREGNVPAEDLTKNGIVRPELNAKLETDTLCMRVYANRMCEPVYPENQDSADARPTHYAHPLMTELLAAQIDQTVITDLKSALLDNKVKVIDSRLANGYQLRIIKHTCYLEELDLTSGLEAEEQPRMVSSIMVAYKA